jgi:hypothetical protein
MDADSQARQLLDRMAVDFTHIVKRSDVDYYFKGSPPANTQAGNDQIAFYSTVPGYYPSSGSSSPLSLVVYRVNAQNKLERMGKGLVWNGVTTGTPLVFLPLTISGTWPAATNGDPDNDYEEAGQRVFRFEYSYLLTDGTRSVVPGSISGLAGIVVDIAVIDSKSKVLVTNAQISSLVGSLIDWGDTSCANCPTQTQWPTLPGLLRAQWRAAVDANAIGLPRPVISGIRLYERYFYF